MLFVPPRMTISKKRLSLVALLCRLESDATPNLHHECLMTDTELVGVFVLLDHWETTMVQATTLGLQMSFHGWVGKGLLVHGRHLLVVVVRLRSRHLLH